MPSQISGKKLITFGLMCGLMCCVQVRAQDAGEPQWGSFLKKRLQRVDKLLRSPFRDAPEEDPKGLASKLRARELDIPNRIEAIRYLKTFHCTKFPEARDMLVDVMLNDRWEPVRFEAARALRDMFAECACGTRSASQTAQDRLRGAPDADSPRHCRCCANAETLNKIARVAYEIKDDGCTFEPSRRVRQMAVQAIASSGIRCCYQPYRVGEEFGPPAWEKLDGSGGNDGNEVKPPPATEEGAATDANGVISLPKVTKSVPIERLKTVCIVSLYHGRKVVADSEIAASYRGRKYHFADSHAQSLFEADPEKYAVAFGGCDPVHYVRHREVVEGRYLVRHNDRYYMFATRQNYDTFKTDLARYTGQPSSPTETPSESSTSKVVQVGAAQ